MGVVFYCDMRTGITNNRDVPIRTIPLRLIVLSARYRDRVHSFYMDNPPGGKKSSHRFHVSIYRTDNHCLFCFVVPIIGSNQNLFIFSV